jgi:SAM-dependent methyltransferase
VKRHAPAAARNRAPIAAVLAEELPAGGLVLEIASGSGEHAIHFARTFPRLQWQPSDPDPAARASIAAWAEAERLPNLLPPLDLDAAAPHWPVARADAVLCINMVHISPMEASEGLVGGAARLLSPGARLILYGPYLEDHVEPAPSNLAFDADLKARDPRWGLRRVAWVDDLARRHGFGRTRRTEMPANNLLLVYRRGA